MSAAYRRAHMRKKKESQAHKALRYSKMALQRLPRRDEYHRIGSNTGTMTSSWVQTLFNGIPQGDDFDTREGNVVRIREIEIRGCITTQPNSIGASAWRS